MEGFQFNFGKLLIFDPGKSKSTCNILASRPSPAEEQSLGRLFILIEIASRDKINIDIINALQEELRGNYYATEDLNIETAFEKALERVNQRIADMVGDYDTNWLDKLNATAVLINKDILLFSTVGKVNSFLIRGQKIIDIVQSTQPDDTHKETINPLKVFSNIVSGTLESGDSILVCTNSLLDYVSQEKLKKTIIDYGAPQAVRSLENILSTDGSNAAFAALILSLTPAQADERETIAPPIIPATATSTGPGSPHASMEDLLQKQTDTGDVLSPSLSRHIRDRLERGYYSFIDFIKLKLLNKSPRRIQMEQKMRYYRPANKESIVKKSTPATIVSGFMKVIQTIGSLIGTGFYSLFTLFKKRKEIISDVKGTPVSAAKRASKIIVAFKRLPKVSKIIFSVAVLVAFLLTQSIYSAAMTKHEEEQSVEYEQTISKISQNILNAENAMSYGNENGARELLTEAQTLISELPDKTEEENAKIRELSNDVHVQLAKLQHVIITDAPREVATFTVEGQTTNVAELQLLGTALYSFDPALKTIFRAEVGSSAVTVWPQDQKNTTFQYFTTSGSATLLFLNTGNGLDEFNVESENLQSLTFELGDVNIISMAPYESRLYLLDLHTNQILRSYRTGNGFGSPVEWMKDDTNLREAESMAIDGFIYVLTKDGTVYRMFQGSRQDWSLATIDPILNRADKIWTDVNTDNLYILDSQGKRIVEFSKEGSLLHQYTSPKFTKIKDFTVDFGNKKLYVLNANTVYEINLQ